MLSREDSDSRPLYITGGHGGPGGEGHPHGAGGAGGAGLGPSVNINVQQLIAHNLHAGLASQQAFQLSSIGASQIINHCPTPSRIFQGRRNILDKMHHFFTSDMGIQHIYVLHGLGGAGKTQIALKFINESSSCFSDTFFIDASTSTTIDTGLKNIAVAKSSGDSPQDGRLWLTSRAEEWLLLFDNADDPSINLNHFIPQCNHGNIIITSRNPGLRVYGSHSPVLDMEEDDAVTLLMKSAAQVATTGTILTATEIVKALYYLPLAIVQAGSFISKSQNLDGYLTLYTQNQARLLSEKPTQTHDHYAWTVYTTWQMSFDRLTQSAAMFLQHCSFLHHNGISEEIFSDASKYTFPSYGPSKEELREPLQFLTHFLGPTGEWDSLQFFDVTNEVQAYSLISFDVEKKLFSIHPLVHAWCQTTVCNPERYMATIGSILGMATDPEQDMQLASLVLCPHVELAVEMDAKVAPSFQFEYGWILRAAGKYAQAKKLLMEVLKSFKELLGNSHPDTLCVMGTLATIHSDLGEYQKAKELNVIVLEQEKQLLGNSHLNTLQTMGVLAVIHTGLGEHEKAKELEVIVLEQRKQLLGENHPQTLSAMGCLASSYSNLGEHQKAKELNTIVLEKQNQVQGENHPDTLLTMGVLAVMHSDLGEHEKAKELEVIVLEQRKQLLGENHPQTLRAMGRLASSYSNLGEHQKAKELYTIVLEKQNQVQGENHPDTLLSMSNLAIIYFRLGEHRKAQELEVIVLEKWKQLLGDNHPDTLDAMENLARTYSTLGEYHKARELQVTVLKKCKWLLGDNHPNTQCVMRNLAFTQKRLSQEPEIPFLSMSTPMDKPLILALIEKMPDNINIVDKIESEVD
ncbi:hypothetical protein K438DRAFT_592924 [Mycena galopus ATCC 62051]|nr:hypothetical protein K438DRAFT_592924 [Mycena galopus ATCC 62051]